MMYLLCDFTSFTSSTSKHVVEFTYFHVVKMDLCHLYMYVLFFYLYITS